MISVFEPNLTYKDKFAVYKTLMKNNISGTSPVIEDFEQDIAKKFGRKHAIALSNGSIALDASFQMLNLKKGEEVILPSFTIVSCLAAVIRTGATPIFCDVDINSWNMSFENIKQCVTDKTKAILMVHTYGLPAEAKEIEEFCTNNDITLVEDAAEAHGQIIDGRYCGSFGEISTFSFYANKHITTGEGGMVLTDSSEIDSLCRQIRNLDFSLPRFQHENFYWNYRMSGMQAALGRSQVNNLDKTINLKKRQGNYYQDLLSDYGDLIQLPLKKTKESENQYWVFGVVLKENNMRDRLMISLGEKGIETRPFFWPLHLQKALPNELKNREYDLPVSENLGSNGLYLPLGKHVSTNKQKFISKALIESILELNK
tara:strand:- start:4235 stop:5350 length:1116 start_codon:yes stop_codon:yes gene_type:complete